MSTRISIAAATLVAALAVAPAAFAQAPKPVFNVVALGDSFASGEGAPQIAGQHSAGGRVIGEPNVWDATVPAGSAAFLDADDCHRSPKAGAPLAAARLAAEFPEIDVRFRSFACSGASTGEGILGPYTFRTPDSGARLRGEEVTKPAQIRQARDAFGATPIDAVVMNVGGNDVNFKKIVQRCFNITLVGRCDTGLRRQNTLDEFQPGFQTLNGRFDRVARALASTGLQGEEELPAPARKVIFTAVPNLATGDGDQPCDGETTDAFVENLVRGESIFVRELIFEPLIGEFERAAGEHGWAFADGVIDGFAGHGICATDNFINTNIEAVTRQGEDSATSGLPLVAVSSGFAHPNYDGYEVYADAIYPELKAELRARFTPPPVRPVPKALEAGAVVFGFQGQLAEFAVHHEIQLLSTSGAALGPPVASAPGETELRVPLPAGAGDRFLALARACGPLTGGRACTPFSAPRPVSVVAPPPPTGLTLTPGRPDSPLVPGPEGALTAQWLHPTGDPDVRRFVLTAGKVTLEADGPARRAAVFTGMQDRAPATVSVVACSDFACSLPATATGQAGTGKFPFKGGPEDLLARLR
jgi:lysophospholipase L1-like esterase